MNLRIEYEQVTATNVCMWLARTQKEVNIGRSQAVVNLVNRLKPCSGWQGSCTQCKSKSSLEVKAYKQAFLCSSQAVQVTELVITADCAADKTHIETQKAELQCPFHPAECCFAWLSVTVFCSCGCCDNVVKREMGSISSFLSFSAMYLNLMGAQVLFFFVFFEKRGFFLYVVAVTSAKQVVF